MKDALALSLRFVYLTPEQIYLFRWEVHIFLICILQENCGSGQISSIVIQQSSHLSMVIPSHLGGCAHNSVFLDLESLIGNINAGQPQSTVSPASVAQIQWPMLINLARTVWQPGQLA